MRVIGPILAIGIIVASFETSARGQGRVIPEADRWVKLGTRIEPLPPGEGGQLTVAAPAVLCAADRLLEVRFYPWPAVEQVVVRIPAPLSSCRWVFEGMAEGEYDATIQIQQTGDILGTARGRVIRGAQASMNIEPLDVEVEGIISFRESRDGNGTTDQMDRAAMDGLRVHFSLASPPHYDWTVPLAADGSYRVKLGGLEPTTDVCVTLVRPNAMNAVWLKCTKFGPGHQRFDLSDVHVPPGLIRIEVPADSGAAFADVARIEVGTLGKQSDAYMTSFKRLRGFRGEFMAEPRDYDVTIKAADGRTVLVSTRVAVSADRPITDLKLELPR
jgi:hypothetical protein